MDFKVRMRKIMIHEFGFKADSFKQALQECHRRCDQLDSFHLVAVMFEIESVTGAKNDKGNNTKKQSRSTKRKTNW